MERHRYVALLAAMLTSGCGEERVGGSGDGFTGDGTATSTGGPGSSGGADDPTGGWRPDQGGGPDEQPDPVDDPVIRPPAPPPPITGGTMIVTADGGTAVVADPDRDRVTLVDLASWTVRAQVPLEPGDWPMRPVEDGDGRVHVTLRGPGAVVTLDVSLGVVLDRRHVCANPRGIVHDPADDTLAVACAGGDLVRLPPVGTAPLTRTPVAPDLRDIWLDGDHVALSRFRTAEVITVDRDGTVMDRHTPAHQEGQAASRDEPPPTMQARTAWRTIPHPRGWLMLHQRARVEPLPSGPVSVGTPEYYGGFGCRKVVVAALTARLDGVELNGGALQSATLAVDVAISPDASLAAFALASGPSGDVAVMSIENGTLSPEPGARCRSLVNFNLPGSFQSVAFDASGRVLAQSRDPSVLYRIEPYFESSESLELGGTSVTDTGHQLFHDDPGQGIACASCHPEGGDDGHTWVFEDIGSRRTPRAVGPVLETAPYHWSGDIPDFEALMDEVFVNRMGGRPQSAERAHALADWSSLAPNPNPTRSEGDEAAQRGEAAFERLGCKTCHAGPHYTNNLTTALAPDRVFQVPPLRDVAHRAPYMHDGRAADLEGAVVDMLAFRPGDVEPQPGDVDDLVAFLETL